MAVRSKTKKGVLREAPNALASRTSNKRSRVEKCWRKIKAIVCGWVYKGGVNRSELQSWAGRVAPGIRLIKPFVRKDADILAR